MPSRIKWQPDMDKAIIEQRKAGASWEATAAVIGVEIKACMRRAKMLGISTDRIAIGPIRGVDVIGGRRPNIATLHRKAPRSTRWENAL